MAIGHRSRISKSGAPSFRLVLACLAVAALTGACGESAAKSSRTPGGNVGPVAVAASTSTPSPKATPTPAPEQAHFCPAGSTDCYDLTFTEAGAGFVTSCKSPAGAPGAAPYGGASHPLVKVVSGQATWYGINGFPLFPPGGMYPRGVQLIACEESTKVYVKTCGKYQVGGVGDPKELTVYRTDVKIRVIFASTAETMATKSLQGTPAKCPGDTYFANSDGPWEIVGDSPGADDYLLSLTGSDKPAATPSS